MSEKFVPPPNPERNAGKNLEHESVPSRDNFRGGGSMKNHFVHNFVNSYIAKALDPEHPVAVEKQYALLKERLRDSTLIDLGCGDPGSVVDAFEFTTAFDVKEYIGVDKYPLEPRESYTDFLEYIQTHPDTFEAKTLTQLLKNHLLPSYELMLKTDMLTFLKNRKVQANFMMNGIDEDILSLEFAENREGLIQLQKEISRLVPPGGLVFGTGSVFLNKLADLGFRQIEEGNVSSRQFWEKI